MSFCCPCLCPQSFETVMEGDGSFPEMPISYSDLKHALRSGLSAEARLFWWPFLPSILAGTLVAEYPNIEDTSLKSVADAVGDRTAEILSLIHGMHDLEEPELIKNLIDILVLMLPRIEVVFKTTCDILGRPDWFISPSAMNHRLKLFTFRELVKQYLPKVAAKLERIGALGAEFLNLIFVEFFKSLLPFPYVARIIDSFLLEGSKVLHRYGLGLVYCNRDVADDPLCSTGKFFWEEVRRRCHDKLNFNELCSTSFHLGRRRNPFSSKGVTLQRKKMGGLEGVTRLKLGESAKLPLNIGRKDKQPSPDMGEFAISKVSKIVDAPSASRLRMFLPESSSMEGFRLVFSTARDGWNLDTLYKRTSGMSPCIIILRSLQQHVIVGAYIPVPISPPSNSVRGNGTTFVFRLCGDTSASYRWDGEESSGVVNPLVGNLVSSRSSTRDQFVMCTEDCIMLGGSAEHGTNALRIDHELKTCASGPSDTYRNPPLAPEEFVQPFVIGELEVLCGMTSADLTMKQSSYEKASWSTEKEARGLRRVSIFGKRTKSSTVPTTDEYDGHHDDSHY